MASQILAAEYLANGAANVNLNVARPIVWDRLYDPTDPASAARWYVMDAGIARWRAEWCARTRCPTETLVGQGLDLAARSLAIMPDNVDGWITRAALHLITTRGATAPEARIAAATEARQATERALAINAFRAREVQPLLDEAIRLQALH